MSATRTEALSYALQHVQEAEMLAAQERQEPNDTGSSYNRDAIQRHLTFAQTWASVAQAFGDKVQEVHHGMDFLS